MPYRNHHQELNPIEITLQDLAGNESVPIGRFERDESSLRRPESGAQNPEIDVAIERCIFGRLLSGVVSTLRPTEASQVLLEGS